MVVRINWWFDQIKRGFGGLRFIFLYELLKMQKSSKKPKKGVESLNLNILYTIFDYLSSLKIIFFRRLQKLNTEVTNS